MRRAATTNVGPLAAGPALDAGASRVRARVLTLNLWGRHGSWSRRRRALVGRLSELRPDLVAFQESVVTSRYDQVIDLLGNQYYVSHHPEREPQGEGISIASRWPLGAVHRVNHHVSARTANGAGGTLVAEVFTPGPVGPLLFVNHFPSWQLSFEFERERQAVATAQLLEDLAEPESHVVVAGDLDAPPDAASLRFWTGRQSLGGMSVCYRDAWDSSHPEDAGHTFTPINPLMADADWPFRRVDYVLVRCGNHGGPTLNIKTCVRVFDEPLDGVWASDHFGVMAELEAPRVATPSADHELTSRRSGRARPRDRSALHGPGGQSRDNPPLEADHQGDERDRDDHRSRADRS